MEPTKALLDQQVTVTGTVYDTPRKKEHTTLIPLENCVINGVQTKLKLNVYCKSFDPAHIGDVMYVETAEKLSFPEKDAFYYHTLSGGCWLRAYATLAENTGATNNSLWYRIKRFREKTTETLLSHLGETDGGIAAALLTGDKNALTEDFVLNLSITGGSHLFAVSGMHLSIWTGLIFLILRKRSRVQVLPNIAAIAFALAYMAVTGFSPSVVRAGLMLIVTFTGRILRRVSDGLNSLGISALLLLAKNIYLAGNVSFLLSFAATWGIITLTPFFTFRVNRPDQKPNIAHRTANSIINTVLLSLVAIAFTVPVSSFFFTGVSLLSPVISLLCALPVQITMISAFTVLCYGNIPYLGTFCRGVCSLGCRSVAFFVNTLAQWDFCVLPVRQRFLLIWYAVTGAVLLVVYYRFGKKSMRVLCALLLSASLLLAVQITQSIHTNRNPMIYIHGTGNNTAITLNINSNAFCAQIGTGADYATLRSINNYYSQNGITKPDVLIIPRVSDAENGNTDSFAYKAKTIFSAAGNETLTGYEAKMREADRFTVSMGKSFTYTNETNPVFSAGILTGNNYKIVFSFYPGGDFTQAEEEWKTGDLLICRGGLPNGLSASDFSDVIVLTDKPAQSLGLPPGTRSTADTGSITIVPVSAR